MVFVFCIVVLFALFPMFILYEDPLSGYNWKEKINVVYPKPWVKYKEAFVASKVNRVDLRQNMIRALKVLRNIIQPSALVRNSSKAMFDHIELSPLFRLGLRSPKYIAGSVHAFLPSASWILKLNTGIHSVITLRYLRIFGNTDICGGNVQIMHYNVNPQYIFVFCGIYSNFHVYPPSHQVKYILKNERMDTFQMITVFDINTQHIIDTVIYEPTSAKKNYRSHIIAVFIVDQVITSLHIIVSKFKQVVIAAIPDRESVFVFDGPGFLSEKRKVFKVPFLCSAFQCILQMRQEYGLKYNKNTTDILFAEEWHKSNAKNISLKDGEKKVARMREKKAYFGIFRVTVPNGLRANVSILSIKYKGKEHPECLFSGLVFFDKKDHSNQEIETHCFLQRKSFLIHKGIYSSGSELIFVSYAFLNYGLLGFVLRLSSTSCHLIRINVCTKFHDHIMHLSKDPMNFLRNYHNAFQQTSLNIKLNITTFECTVAQLFVMWWDNCFHFSMFVLGYEIKLPAPMLFKGLISVEKNTQQTEQLQYRVYGILASKSTVLMSPHSVEDALFIIFGKDLHHNKFHDLYVGEMKAWESIKTSPSKQKFYDLGKLAATLFYNAFKDTKTLLMLKPSFGKYLYFSCDVSSQMPTHQGSPAFYISFIGGNSWIDLFLGPSGKKVVSALLITPKPSPVLRIPNRQALLLSMDKLFLIKNYMMLQLNITLKVSALFFSSSTVSIRAPVLQ